MSKVLGIDLGTTNSVVAVYDDGEPRIVSRSANRRTTPSIISFTEDGQILVGDSALKQQVTNPMGTVYSIKRFMGRRHGEVRSEEKLVPYEVVGRPDEFVKIKVGKKKYTPQEISALILRELRKVAERQIGEECERAVVTVPAYFNEAQRQATKDAGQIAGLTVERIINEPTAAALACGVEKRGDRSIVVFDFGGGTFDLSAMQIADGSFRVLAVHGNTHLGGDDFDQRIIDVVAEDFLRHELIDVRKDPMALQRLKQAAQQAKGQLSTVPEAQILLPYIAMDGKGPKHLQYLLTRETFEGVCADLFEDVRSACRQLLSEAGLTRVADVVMVGGSMRIPKVQDIAKEIFNTQRLDKSINPDEVVANGAAILGGVIQGDLHNVHLMDVTSHGFGVEMANGRMKTLVPKDTAIPTTVTEIFSTPSDNQTAVPINVLEGESDEVVDNRPLGIFRLTGIRRAPRGVPRIEVEFDIDANGILKVSATDKDTGRSQDIVVTGRFGLDDAEKDRMKRENDQTAARAEIHFEQVEVRNHAESVHANMMKWLEYNRDMITTRSADQLLRTLQKLAKAVKKDDRQAMMSTLRKLDELSHIYGKAG